jgi:hypothetical protein
VKIISADERLKEQAGAKILLIGPSGVGKTSQLKTLLASTTLFIDIEAGHLAIAGHPVATLRPRTWPDCCNFAAVLGGPNPALPPTSYYSQTHYDAAAREFDVGQLGNYSTLFVDSLTAAARLSFVHAEQQPEAFTDRGKKDLRSVYGLHARQMIGWLSQLQQARGRNVILVAILEKITDEFKTVEWVPQIEGSKTARELPGIVDQIVTMQFLDFGDGKLSRAFVCSSPNPWGLPAKDRSGRLQQLEEPDLGKLIAKLVPPAASAANQEQIGG